MGLNSLESFVFILTAVAVLVALLVFLYVRYYTFRKDTALSITMFNRNCFLKDRDFFEKYGEKKTLQAADLIRMYGDAHFREHVLEKEVNYYRELTKIVGNLRLLRVYAWGSVVLFFTVLAGVVLYGVYSTG